MTPEQIRRRKHSEKTLEERLADVCPGCGLHAIVDGACTLCGKNKAGGEVYVGETRIA